MFYKYFIIIIINCYFFIHTLFNCKQFTKVRAATSSRTSPYPSHLTRPHPHAVWRKVIIISDCRLVPYWREFLGVSWSWTRLDLPFANTYVSLRWALNRLSYLDRLGKIFDMESFGKLIIMLQNRNIQGVSQGWKSMKFQVRDWGSHHLWMNVVSMWMVRTMCFSTPD